MRITVNVEDGDTSVTGTAQPATSDTPRPPAEVLAAAAALGAIDGGPAPAGVPANAAVTASGPAEASAAAQHVTSNAMSAGPAPGTPLEAEPETISDSPDEQ